MSGIRTANITRAKPFWFSKIELWFSFSVTFSRINGDLNGQVVAFFTMVVAACEVVVGLAIIVTIYRSRRSASVDDASLLKR